ncbi:MAG TPA: hypothetical protein VKU79_07800 [Thermoplasmataceae archaeon]|nr:hypothetical protein [Thermoplasmatales archaeon AK]HLH86745.1 hypothetical protein [Thermoplasmataceae archaeon]
MINQNQYEIKNKSRFIHLDHEITTKSEPLGDRLFWVIILGIVSLGAYGITALLI